MLAVSMLGHFKIFSLGSTQGEFFYTNLFKYGQRQEPLGFKKEEPDQFELQKSVIGYDVDIEWSRV